MPAAVIMPALELAQETGKVLRWLKRAGDTVSKGEPIVEIETDKVTVEIDYPHSDANWPRGPEKLMGEFEAANLTDDEINAITHLNAMREFHYDPFSVIPREKCTVGALRADAIGVDTEPRSMSRSGKVEHEGTFQSKDAIVTA